MLAGAPERPVRVFVVWEPMLPTDLVEPTSSILELIADARAAQYWDPSRLASAAIRAAPAQPKPKCCDDQGILWDLAAVYPRGARWSERLPAAAFLDGTVADAGPSLREAVLRLSAR